MKIYGTVVNDEIDSVGERFVVEGCDFSALSGKELHYEFDDTKPVGQITKAELRDGRIVVEAELSDADLQRLVDQNALSFGVSGVCLERENNVLTKTLVKGLSLVRGGVHPDYKVKK